MDYVEKRKNGRKRIFKKLQEEHDKQERIATIREKPIAIKNDKIFNSIYKNLSLNEKKLFRYILSLIKKSDDVDTTFILKHTIITELLKKHYTSQDIHTMLDNVSSSLKLKGVNANGKKQFLTIPIFKVINTSESYDSTEVIFNEKYNDFIFFCYKEGHFLKYELGNILDYKALHTIELFELLLAQVKENQWEEIVSIEYDIEELKELLDCEKQRTNNFINQVIKKSIEEINKYNKNLLGGTVDYKYNKTKKKITFGIENVFYMLKQEKKR